MRIETTTDHQRIVGLLVPNAVVESVLQGFCLSLTHNHAHTCFCLIVFEKLDQNLTFIYDRFVVGSRNRRLRWNLRGRPFF